MSHEPYEPGGDGGAPKGAEGIAGARLLLEDAERVVVVTGAGVSAESGVPTFRGEEGLWRNHRPEELATPGAFRRDPRLVWEWYQWRRELVAGCEPNPAHRALARYQHRRGGVRIVTQNVDGLHGLALGELEGDEGDADLPAGETPAPPLELHGSLFRVRCSSCSWRAERREAVDSSSRETLPRCPRCDALVRPAVVWFGESLDAGVLEQAIEAAATSEVCLVVGTSAVVQPAASIPLVTLREGGSVVEVNPTETPLTPRARISLRGAAGSILPDLLDR